MNRPVGVYIAAVLMLISSLIGLFIAFRGLGIPLFNLGSMKLNPGTPVFFPVLITSATMLVLSSIGIFVSIGLLFFKGWARSGAVTIAVFLLLGDLFFSSAGGFGLGRLGPDFVMLGAGLGLGGALINLIIIIYLSLGSTKEAFET